MGRCDRERELGTMRGLSRKELLDISGSARNDGGFDVDIYFANEYGQSGGRGGRKEEVGEARLFYEQHQTRKQQAHGG